MTNSNDGVASEGGPRYPYGEWVVLGALFALIGYSLASWPGAAIGAVLLILVSIAATELGWRPDHA